MNKKNSIEENLQDEYNNLWSDPDRIARANEDMLLGWHFGFYEKGIKNSKEAMLNMNRYVSCLIDLDSKKPLKVLDAGCGIGGTSTLLAKDYPNSKFIGISLASNEIELAKKLKKEYKTDNVEFIQGTYYETVFENNYFDRIFALESVSYSKNLNGFLVEMNRILKKNGKLVIIDLFRKRSGFNYYVNDLECRLFNKRPDFGKKYTINTFESDLKSNGFYKIEIKDLVKSGNVKLWHIYGFIIKYFYSNLYLKFKHSSFKNNIFSLKCAFVFLFLIETLLLFCSKASYSSITSFKKN